MRRLRLWAEKGLCKRLNSTWGEEALFDFDELRSQLFCDIFLHEMKGWLSGSCHFHSRVDCNSIVALVKPEGSVVDVYIVRVELSGGDDWNPGGRQTGLARIKGATLLSDMLLTFAGEVGEVEVLDGDPLFVPDRRQRNELRDRVTKSRSPALRIRNCNGGGGNSFNSGDVDSSEPVVVFDVSYQLQISVIARDFYPAPFSVSGVGVGVELS